MKKEFFSIGSIIILNYSGSILRKNKSLVESRKRFYSYNIISKRSTLDFPAKIGFKIFTQKNFLSEKLKFRYQIDQDIKTQEIVFESWKVTL